MQQNNSINNTLLSQYHINTLIDNNPIVKDYKRKAKVLQKKLKEDYKTKDRNDFLSRRQCQDLVAQQHGYKHWHEFHTNIKKLYLEKKEYDLFKHGNKSHMQQFPYEKKLINIGYNPILGLNTWIEQDKLLEHIFIEGQNDFRASVETHLIKQFIEQGKHVIYMDGNNNSKNTYNIIQYAKESGREKDIRILSFGDSFEKNTDLQKYNWYLPENLPFSSGRLTEMIYSMLDEGNNDMWKGKAISLISTIIMALTYMRDKNEIILNFDIMEHYLRFENFITLKQREDLPKHIQEAIKTYLHAIKFNPNDIKQTDRVLEQHGFLQMQFLRIFGLFHEYKILFNGGNTVENARERLNELYGGNEKLIFIIQFPDFSINSYEIEKLSYLVMEFILNQTLYSANNREENILNKDALLNKKSNTYIFINNCPLDHKISIKIGQLRSFNTSFILSYNNKENICSFKVINKNFQYIYDNINTRFTWGLTKLDDKGNSRFYYKVISSSLEENLIL